jgi:DNA repair ATPase RecN
MSTKQVESEGSLSVRNIGGIDETELTFEPGVTILSGRNATNRTSLLQSIMAALGSDNVSIKADADEAHVELTIDSDRINRLVDYSTTSPATATSSSSHSSPKTHKHWTTVITGLLESSTRH